MIFGNGSSKTIGTFRRIFGILRIGLALGIRRWVSEKLRNCLRNIHSYYCFRVTIFFPKMYARSNLLYRRPVFNPLSPDIKMHILLTVLHTFVIELVMRICLNIKTFYPW